ncbi:MAG: DUF885 domain-containing protein [bacterium]
MNNERFFYEMAEKLIYRMLELDPVAATEMGLHKWDDRYLDNDPDAMEGAYIEMRDHLSRFASMPTSGFSADALIDYEIILHLLQSTIWEHEVLRKHRRDPGYHIGQITTGVFLLLIKQYAPLEARLRNMLGRMESIPKFIENAMNCIESGEVPAIWAKISIDQMEQIPSIFLRIVPEIASSVGGSIESDLKRQGEKAADAIDVFKRYISSEVLPNASGDFAIGRDAFDEMLKMIHMVDYDSKDLIAVGWEAFEQTRAQMERLACQIDPSKSVHELIEESRLNHPTEETLLDEYARITEEAKQFVISKDLVSMPQDETLRIIETPDYLKPLIPYGAYIPAGIFDEKQEGVFLVTPVDQDMPDEIKEQKLRGHSYSKIRVVALHEAYPGHHLQLSWANRNKSLPRRMAHSLSTMFVEGWAFYCEEMMENFGFILDPVDRLGRLRDQLWRAGRIILDSSLHTRRMSVDEAINFLVEHCKIEPGNARAEVNRYTTTPTQPQSYLMGKLEILKIVEEYRREHTGVPLKMIHDEMMRCGSLPPSLMGKKLLGRS